MREFTVRILNQGKIEAKTLQAESAEEAQRLLASQGIHVLSVKAGTKKKKKNIFSLNLFIQELVALLDAGLVLVETLETLRDKSPPAQQQILDKILEDMYQGKPFSTALAAQPTIFPELLIASVASSEHTGQLGIALARYNHYEGKIDTLRKQVTSTMLYPLIVIGVGGAILLFMLFFVIPGFSTVFADMGNVKGSARFIVWWGNIINHHGLKVGLGIAIAFIALFFIFKQPIVRGKIWELIWKIPKLAEQRLLFILTRFYRTLGLLLSGGLPVINALSLAGSLLPSSYAQALPKILESIRAGQALSTTLKTYHLTTPVALRLLQVGEQSGDLPGMCERTAQFHDEALERAIEAFSKVFEPILMLVVGSLIGIIIFLLYMPIFELAGGISQ